MSPDGFVYRITSKTTTICMPNLFAAAVRYGYLFSQILNNFGITMCNVFRAEWLFLTNRSQSFLAYFSMFHDCVRTRLDVHLLTIDWCVTHSYALMYVITSFLILRICTCHGRSHGDGEEYRSPRLFK